MKEDLLKLLLENPEFLSITVKGYVEKYKPVVYDLLNELLNIYKDYANNTEYPATVAKVKKNLYDAYVTVGFTEDQAMALMINDNIRLMDNIKKVSTSVSNSSKKAE